MFARTNSLPNRIIRTFLAQILFLGLFTAILGQPAIGATTDKCDGTSTQNSITVSASHGKVFYIDSGQNQTIDAAYIGYKINVGAAKSNVWAKVDNFTGGVLGLADPNDAAVPVGDITSGYKSAYFLLKATSSSNSAQSHVLHIYEGKPGLAGTVEKYSCTFTFTKVSETIKAAANKVDSIATSATTFILGQTMTITVRGATGTIGSGTALDGDMMWLSPASRSSWPSSELRLKSTSVDFWENSNYSSNHVSGYPVSDVLQVKNLRAVVGKNPYKLYYQVVYTFQVVGTTPSAVAIAPVAQISSGTQIKHTDMSTLPTASVNTNSVTVDASITKSVATTAEVVGGKMRMTYTLTLRNLNTSTAVTVDQIMDKPSTSLTYVATSAKLNNVTVAVADEPSLDAAGYLVYAKPVTIAASSTATFVYKMEEKSACTGTSAFSYTNSAYAKIGSVTIGSGASTFSFTTAGGTCGSATLTETTTVNSALPVEVVTIEASSVAGTTATLNAMIDPNGNSGQTVSFQWGTSATLSGATTVNLASTTTSATSPYAVSSGLTGLSTGTVYYFRIKVGTVYGAILSFVTTEPVGTPTAVTNSVSNVSSSGSGGGMTYIATLNGSIDPNQVSGGSGAKFEYGQDSNQTSHACGSLSSTTTGVVKVLDESGAETADPLNLNGAFPSDVSKDVTSLVPSKWYCYRVVATWSTSSTAAGSFVSFYTGTMNNQTITFPQPDSKTVGSTLALTGGSAATTTSSLTITYSSNTPSICTISGTTITMLAGGTCSITASQPGNFEYYEAPPVTVTFQVVAPNKTVTFNANGGSGSISSQTTNVTTPLTTNSFTRSGYSFVGWSTTSGVQDSVYSDGGDYDFSADITVYAQWIATITYDANGATSGVAPSSQTGGPGVVLATRLNTDSLAKTNLTFAGWNTAANGSGTSYSAGSNLTVSGSITLYAQYHAVLTYDGNSKTSGTVASPVSQLPGNVTLDTGTALSRTDYTFAGWNSLASGLGSHYDTLSVFNLSVNTTLYAQWNATIVYNGNTEDSGSVPSSQTSTAGSTITLQANSGNLVKTSNTFGGWNTQADGGGTTFAVSTSYVITGNKTLYAVWSSSSVWRIDYSGNSNTSGSIPSFTTVNRGSETSTATNSGTLARTGYTFSGWNTSANGSGTTYSVSSPITPTANVTLYAKWTANAIPVNFYPNGGSGSMSSQSISAGISTALTNNGFTRDGYSFNGWNDTSTATGIDYSDGQNVTITQTLDLYAKWIATISYSGNSNSGGAVPSSQTQSDGSIILRSNSGSLVRTGYTFGGWNTLANGSGTTYAEGASYTLAGSVTLHARWVADTLSVHFDANGGTGSMSNQSVTAGVSTPLTSNAFTYSGFGFVNWSTNSGGGGSVYTDGQSVTLTTNLNLYAQWAAEYAVSYSLNGGSGTTPTETDKATGVSFTLASSSGLSRNGYSFAGWSCNSGSTQAAGTNFTMPASSLTCVAQWSANSSGGGSSNSGGGNTTSTAASTKPTPAVVRKTATLVTLATTPVKSTVVTTTATTPTFGAGTNTPAKPVTPSTGGTTVPGNSSSTPSTGGTTTPAPGNSGSTTTTGGTTERINVNNTQLSQTTAITSTAAKSVTFTGVGITQATVVNNEVAVQAKPGFSGKTTVKITVTTEEEVSVVTADVIVIPLPVTNPVVKVVSDAKSRIQWIRSPNAVTYEVTQNGKLLCTTAGTICTVAQAVSADAPVQIKALGRDQTESTVKQATYVAAPTTPVVPEIALVVNFDTAKYNLDSGDRALIRAFAADVVKYGFTKIDISGHTDSRGGIDNNVLSNNRAKAARAYLLSLLPNLKVTINGYADAISVATNATAEGMTANRRAEFRVVG